MSAEMINQLMEQLKPVFTALVARIGQCEASLRDANIPGITQAMEDIQTQQQELVAQLATLAESCKPKPKATRAKKPSTTEPTSRPELEQAVLPDTEPTPTVDPQVTIPSNVMADLMAQATAAVGEEPVRETTVEYHSVIPEALNVPPVQQAVAPIFIDGIKLTGPIIGQINTMLQYNDNIPHDVVAQSCGVTPAVVEYIAETEMGELLAYANAFPG